jgi:putative YhgA-like transposase
MVEALLRGFLDETWCERLDFSSLERVGNSFISEDLRERHSDLIWRVRFGETGGDWVYVYLLLEFQSTSDSFMGVRILTYVALLLEDIIRKENLKAGERLPLILPIVIHSGQGRWRGPLRLESLFVPVPKELKRYLPRLTYLLIDERRLDLNRPELKRNPAAAFFRVETNDRVDALPRLYHQLQDLLPPGDSALWRTVRAWFMRVVQRIAPGSIIPEEVTLEEASMLEENLLRWQEEARREGHREGEIRGLQTMLLDQLTQRFGRLPAQVRRQVEATASLSELRKLGRKVLRAKTLAAMGLGSSVAS